MKLAKAEKASPSKVRVGPAPQLSFKTLRWMRFMLTARMRHELPRRSDVNRFTVHLNGACDVVSLSFCPVNGVTDVQRMEIPHIVARVLSDVTGLVHTHSVQIDGTTAVMLFDSVDYASTNTKKIPSGSYLMKVLKQIPHSSDAFMAVERAIFTEECVPRTHVVWHIRKRVATDAS